ncbi:hypothetical protein L873DRAFT_1789025 [Choiromyces venosus 120613-1]|uniref:Far11/STRP C-terminal domain-containing protein n=1 Tax=Choiromyces venosus 120613-1 TaxID=1336337 RepID=A0A3N4JT83_9PEZI|nr:hypothetical protein L873DRAFT_1789025 [Choiromyces venosus 120613-1]
MIVLLKVILVNLNAPPEQPPLSSPPPSSQQVLFADEEESKSNSQSGSETIHPAIGRVDNVTSSNRSSWNIFRRAVPGGREKEREKERGERKADEKRSLDKADAQRIREITSEAVSAILVGMLKWLWVSHVQKLECLTQPLLDSNYIPLALRSLSRQDIVQTVTTKTEPSVVSAPPACWQN